MQVLCGLQVVFFLFNCQTPGAYLPEGKESSWSAEILVQRAEMVG